MNNNIISYLKNTSLIIIALLALIFPLFFTTATTEFFVLPKQLLIIVSTFILLILFSLRIILEGRISLRASPFNLPIVFFGISVFASSLFSQNIYDSLMQSVPLLFILFLFFLVINTIDDIVSLKLVLYSLIGGGVLSALVTIFHFFKVYLFPYPETQSIYFNTLGSAVQQILYILPILSISLWNLLHQIKKRNLDNEFIMFALTNASILIATVILFYQIFFAQQKIITLPYAHGVQIAFASISYETNRFLPSLLFGSGYGTFSTDFTRFKLPSFNYEKDIWNLVFSYSSSYVLELLATTGILGTLSFLFLLVSLTRTRSKKSMNLYLPLSMLALFSLLFPFSFSVLTLFFLLFALYLSSLYLEKSPHVHNFTLALVALKQGLITIESEEGQKREIEESKILPLLVSLPLLAMSGFATLMAARLLISDMGFKESLNQVTLNNAQKTYDLQTQAIRTFPYRSDYFRVFSQINFTLANSLASSTSQTSSPSSQIQQNTLHLIQQSINTAKTAVTLSPISVANWENLSQIYRGLINVGQNADQFAIGSVQQTISLNPYNPQLYIQLGGIYYQLGEYEAAAIQFQTAVSLKRDLANAYYNLGHAFEANNDLTKALSQYQTVARLVKNDRENYKKMTSEIEALEKRIGEKEKEAMVEELQPIENQPPLEISSSSAQLPPQKPPVKIPPPPQATESAR